MAADTRDALAQGIAALGLEIESLSPLGLDAGLEEQRFTEDPRETVRGDPDGAIAGAEVLVERPARHSRTSRRRSSRMPRSRSGPATG